MIGIQHLTIEGKQFVLVEAKHYDDLCARAGKTVPVNDDDLPPLPKPDKNGRFPALEYARISLSRDLIRDRRAAGLTQKELAELVGSNQETISRYESGRFSSSPKMIDKIDRALQKALAKRKER